MSDCCTIDAGSAPATGRCPSCGERGRNVEPITVKALLRPEALARLSAPAHRFCATPSCPVVYFAEGDVFGREDVAAPVFQKEPPGDRTVCYCFGVGEPDLRREIAVSGRSTAAGRIAAHLRAGRCACEVRNPEGRCCLGHVVETVKALLGEPSPTPTSGEAEAGCPVVSTEPREVQFELKAPPVLEGGAVDVPGYALYYVCEERDGAG